MPELEHFWHSFGIFAQQHDHFGLLLIVALIIAALLWRWRPQDRKPVTTTLLFLTIALLGLALSGVLAALDIKSFATGLYEVSIFAGGMAAIRLFGLFLFRLILPLCRINLLRILEDLAELAGYVTWLMVHLHAAGLDLSGIITTSAVMTAVLAFSMQDTLGNILGGLALQLDNSIKVGDWIKVDDVNGRVTDIRWRSTAIETRNWETIVIPNSLLMKSKFSVIGRRRGQPLQWRRWIYFDVGYEHFAGKVIDIAQNAVRNGRIANVADAPAANCLLMDFSPSSSRYALRYWLCDIEADDVTDSQVRGRVYAALQRAGISLPYPQYHIHMTNKDDQYEQNKRLRRIKERMDALQQVELFNTLHGDELAEIAERLVYTPFVQGDLMMRQGAIAHWLYIIISGVADVFLELPDGGRRRIDTIHGGCFLGEMGLMTGDPRSATVIAQSEVLAYRLDKDSFQNVLDNRPELAVEISKLLASRRFSVDNAQQQLDSESAAQLMAQHQSTFLGQIRSFFGLESFARLSGVNPSCEN
ncbi:mechanosensitive ion channel family protein [Methylobacter sp.]|uniref:mechanosensitive ion channel family protein n=1 Tax=Methylobacter sp. TaxID=2051955 RepID=UPI00120A5315|nr:mechanosensitive ion channel family protein [Methylobacter sp.]TAK63176.1 MAG: mechanosensitive ion channel [Methylobacter sp.]